MLRILGIPLRRDIGLLVVALAILAGGTWATLKLTTGYLLDAYAAANARNWATFLASSVGELEQIANGEQPSRASLIFLVQTRRAAHLFRYVIYNREGYSQLIADRDHIALVDVSEFSAEAAQAVARDAPVVAVKSGTGDYVPRQFAEAFVPARVNGKMVAVVGASVDQTEIGHEIYGAFTLVAVILCSLTAFAFALPAFAWFRRTREKQEADRRIRYLAHHDPLTGLTNRGRLIERLDGLLAKQRANSSQSAVHFIDVDHFKEINDRLGHDAGDFVLKTVAQRLRATTRPGDIVARLGGDEFIVVQTEIAGRDHADAFARRLVAALTVPMRSKGQDIPVTVTIGIALAPVDDSTPERLLKCADLALYNGKAAGRHCVRFFSSDMDQALEARLTLEKTLREAVAEERLELHYQPIFDMHTRRTAGFEALLRLAHPDGGYISPTTFIPVAEELRLIHDVGRWVLRDACRTAVLWPGDLPVAVNLSPFQFESGSISSVVADALQESGLDASRLELEITESLMLGDNEHTIAELHQLKAMGVAIVMDDFGTGYSSLNYLWKFPFDKIKIDRSFMQGFDTASRNVETVVKTMIALGRELDMSVTVEGVETARQFAFLEQARPDLVQGFFFARPLPAADIAAKLIEDLAAELRSRMADGDGESRLQTKPSRRKRRLFAP